METRSGAQPNLQRELHLVYDSMLGGYSIRGGTRSVVGLGLGSDSIYRAKSMARVSRITTTLICPGYWSSFSMRRATTSEI
jgi:hypothetical protein